MGLYLKLTCSDELIRQLPSIEGFEEILFYKLF